MRIRTIKPEFFKHDALASLPPLTRILFVGLWCLADCEGRLEDRPQRIKAEVLPYDEIDVEAALASLSEAKFVVRYQNNGLSLLQVVAFRRHQRITGKEADAASRFPAPEELSTGKQRKRTVKQQGNNGETTETTGNGREGKGKETEGKGDAGASAPVEVYEIPLLLRTPQFSEVWERWVKIRKSSKSRPKTPWAEFFAEQLKWLEKFGPEAATESVSASIRNDWKGLFEPKTPKRGSTPLPDHLNKW